MSRMLRLALLSLCICLLSCGGLGHQSTPKNTRDVTCRKDGASPSCAPEDKVNGFAHRTLTPTPISRHLYLLALGPLDAFKTEKERAALWKALQGESPSIKPLLGSLDQIPMDYRIEYIFNHESPSSPKTEFHRIRPWAKRLGAEAQARVRKAQTLLLVKGDLTILPNAHETRLTLSALVFLAEKYEGVVFDLLTRQAFSAQMLRARLNASEILPAQIRFVGTRIKDGRALRTLGLSKYGFPDLLLMSMDPKRDVAFLSKIVDAVLAQAPLPHNASLKPCVGIKFDHGCYEVVRTERTLP